MHRFDLGAFDVEAFAQGLDPASSRHPIDTELRVGVRPTAVGPGRAIVELDGVEAPHLGWLATLADSAMGTAYAEVLGEGWTCATVSMHIEALGEGLAPGIPVHAFGRLLSDDGVADCVMLQDGRAAATALGRFIPLGIPTRPEATGIVSLQAEGLDLAAGLGLDAAWAPDMDLTFDAEAPLVANPSGIVHGGLQMALGAEALDRSIDQYTATQMIELSAHFFVPAPATGRLALRVRRLHSGRRLSVARADILRPDGRVATTVEATIRAAQP